MSAAPTAVPTPDPTQLLDCRSSCSFLTDGSSATLSAGNFLAMVQLPTHFQITFDVKVASLAAAFPDEKNILMFVDLNDYSAVFAVTVPDYDHIRIWYGGQQVDSNGPQLLNNYANVFTTVTVGVAYGYSRSYITYGTTQSVSSTIDLTGKTLALFASAPTVPPHNIQSTGGEIKNIYIKCKHLT